MGSRPSRLWLLVPILFGVAGGVIAYFVIKSRDREFAKILLVVGIIISGIHIIGGILYGAFVYLFMTSNLKTVTKNLEVAYSYCMSGETEDTVVLYVTNPTDTIVSAHEWKCLPLDAECTGTCETKDVLPGEKVEIRISGCKKGRTHTWIIIYPGGERKTTVYCA